MSTTTSVGVNDNLTTCETCITVRTSDDKLSCRVDEVFYIVVKQFQHLWVVQLCLDTRYQDVDDIVLDLCKHWGISIEFVVLC